MRTFSKFTLAMLLGLAASHLAWAASPIGTAFNFQGYLTDNNKKSLTGQYDIQFLLYDVSSSGSALATDVRAPVTVNNGLFSTLVDFSSFKFDGNAYWLEVGFRPNGDSNPYQIQSPRIQILPVPYALYAGAAGTASAVAANAVGGIGLQDNSITASKISGGQVVKSLNGLFDNVTLQGDGNVTVTPSGNTITIGSSGLGSTGWSLTGNGGTTPGLNFLGTTDNEPLELWANNSRALRLEYTGFFNPITKQGSTSINLIGGYLGNQTLNGAVGVTIAGGGYSSSGLGGGNYPNRIAASFGSIGGGAGNFIRYGTYATIAGGYDNLAGDDQAQTGFYSSIGGGLLNSALGTYSAIPGGYHNSATGRASLAAGYLARATHDRSFVWNSYTSAANSFASDRFHVFAQNGFSVDYDTQREDGGGSHWAGIGLAGGQTISTWTGAYLGDAGDWHCNALNVYDNGGGVGIFGGNLQPFGIATFESNLSSSRTHAWFAENGNCVFNVTGGGAGYFGGNLSVCTLTIRGGCDLAEPFDMAEDEIPNGAVVVIDPQHPGKLKLSTDAYDTRVAGVVSGANGIHPGIAMHQEGINNGGRNVALTGRVYVLADASNGAIHPGDLVTTSAIPGYAMKVTNHDRAQGAILGKAMSELEEGSGSVLVLVTLQ
jgi:hypothetical protein